VKKLPQNTVIFYDQVRADTALGPQTTILVGLAAAMAAGCEP